MSPLQGPVIAGGGSPGTLLEDQGFRPRLLPEAEGEKRNGGHKPIRELAYDPFIAHPFIAQSCKSFL